SLGYAHHHLGHHTQAIACYQHALRLLRDLGDRYHEATTLTHLGDTHHTAGNPDAARDAWQQALTILDQLDHPHADTVRAKLHQTPAGSADGKEAAPSADPAGRPSHAWISGDGQLRVDVPVEVQFSIGPEVSGRAAEPHADTGAGPITVVLHVDRADIAPA